MFPFHDAFLVIVGFIAGTLMTCLIMEVYMHHHQRSKKPPPLMPRKLR